VRREELARLGVQLPVLPAIVLGALPGEPDWAPRLERIGLDVVGTGAAADSAGGWRAARAAVPFRPIKGMAATADDAAVLAAAGCVILEVDGPAPAGAYRLGPDEALVAAVAPGATLDDQNDVAARILAALAGHQPAALWAAAGPGLESLDPDTVEAKLRALVDGVRLARLVLAKEQFER